MSDAEAREALHPMAQKVLDALVFKDDGAATAIPHATFAKLKLTLQAHRDERRIFEHLAVLYVRLRDGGLKAAAEQLLTLAKLGLEDDEVETAAKQAEALRVAAMALDERTVVPTASALKPKASLGVGLRTQKIKKP